MLSNKGQLKCFVIYTVLLCFTSWFLKKLEIHHDIFQVVAEWYDTNINSVFYVKKFLRKVVSKGVHQASVNPVGM